MSGYTEYGAALDEACGARNESSPDRARQFIDRIFVFLTVGTSPEIPGSTMTPKTATIWMSSTGELYRGPGSTSSPSLPTVRTPSSLTGRAGSPSRVRGTTVSSWISASCRPWSAKPLSRPLRARFRPISRTTNTGVCERNAGGAYLRGVSREQRSHARGTGGEGHAHGHRDRNRYMDEGGLSGRNPLGTDAPAARHLLGR